MFKTDSNIISTTKYRIKRRERNLYYFLSTLSLNVLSTELKRILELIFN